MAAQARHVIKFSPCASRPSRRWRSASTCWRPCRSRSRQWRRRSSRRRRQNAARPGPASSSPAPAAVRRANDLRARRRPAGLPRVPAGASPAGGPNWRGSIGILIASHPAAYVQIGVGKTFREAVLRCYARRRLARRRDLYDHADAIAGMDDLRSVSGGTKTKMGRATRVYSTAARSRRCGRPPVPLPDAGGQRGGTRAASWRATALARRRGAVAVNQGANGGANGTNGASNGANGGCNGSGPPGAALGKPREFVALEQACAARRRRAQRALRRPGIALPERRRRVRGRRPRGTRTVLGKD